ncbi:Chromosome segregation ATPase [Francisella cf. novicida Fx1]|nr:Chromosome segregation ATPase [Francisella cf. novicida Fx1]
MKERIYQSSEYINSLNQVPYIEIRDIYIEEKIKELHLTYEYKVKKQREKEEQAEIRAQMREEARAEAEIKKAEAEALKEQKIYQKALDTARKELLLASDNARVELEEKITELNIKISEIIEKHQRLKSMAEQTKQGHVYIISNIGSFGENVYKIGMTRRLEPNDRVSELGSASVPFVFDIHAMIHTNNAPELEKRLHDRFDNYRLNMKNKRKEFFNVELSEIKKAVTEYTSLDIEFIETAVAQDYYESQAIKKMISQRV